VWLLDILISLIKTIDCESTPYNVNKQSAHHHRLYSRVHAAGATQGVQFYTFTIFLHFRLPFLRQINLEVMVKYLNNLEVFMFFVNLIVSKKGEILT